MHDDVTARFWAKVDKSGDCWEWTAALSRYGYGQFNGGSQTLAHRFSYLLHNGPIPDGLQVCHHCDNRKCVRPDHLFLGTNDDNVADAVRKRRHRRGSRHWTFRAQPPRPIPVTRSKANEGERNNRAKLSEGDVVHVLDELFAGMPTRAVAERYGVSTQAIRAIRDGRSWRHVPRVTTASGRWS